MTPWPQEIQAILGKRMKLALVTGSRHWTKRDALWAALDDEKPSLVIHGGCRTGADNHASEWCYDRGIHQIVVPALWKAHGKSAGPMRNTVLVRTANAIFHDSSPGERKELVVIACPINGKSKKKSGTRDTMDKCERYGWRQRIVE